jgi:hypothetical protein
VHHHDAGLPAADGHRAPARDAACRGATTSRSGDVVEMPLGMVETDIVTKLLDFIPDANATP